MHVAGKPKMQSGYREAQSVYAHHMGSCEHIPAQAWARLGDRMLAIDGESGLAPHQLVAKCEAMLRNGAGWRIQQD
jgi:hypothetical protein